LPITALRYHRLSGLTVSEAARCAPPEDGGEFDPALLAQPLGPLDEDYETANMGVDPLMRTVDAALVAARDAALRLDWKAATDSLVAAGRKINEVPAPSTSYQAPAPVVSMVRSLKRKKEKIDAALALGTGLRLEAVADRGEIVAGESFTVRAESHHRGEIAGEFKKPVVALPADWSITKEEPDSGSAIRFTISAGQNLLRSQASAMAMLPEPPPLVTVTQGATIDGYSFSVSSAVAQLRTSSTRADRIALRMVPAYTLAVEPKQAIEITGKPGKPFDVLLRVHSYATQEARFAPG